MPAHPRPSLERPRRKPLAFISAFSVCIYVGCNFLISPDVPEFRCASLDPSACPPSMTCDLDVGRCLPRVAPGSDGSSVASRDNPGALNDAGVATPAAPSVRTDASSTQLPNRGGPLGAACRVHDDCASFLCGTSTILTVAVTKGTGPVCTTPCCTSEECPAAFVCVHGAGGGNYCVDARTAQRLAITSGSNPGKPGGTTCTSDAECRSGLCTGSPKRCEDTCCSPGDCAEGSLCRIRDPDGRPTLGGWECTNPPTPTADYTGVSFACDPSKPPSCYTGKSACIDLVCRIGCSNSQSCVDRLKKETASCVYGAISSDFVRFCRLRTGTGKINAGEKCKSDTECASEYCDVETRTCANTCARDRDCNATEVCLPSAIGTPNLRCVPRP